MVGFGLSGVAVAAAIVATAVGITQVAGSRACASVASAAGAVSGTATHYVLQAGDGNCSYPSVGGDGLYAALSPPEYDSAAPCGGYLEVTGPDGSVRVEVADQCPPCADGHIDLSAAAFARIAPLSAGLVNVTYQAISDPSLPGPVELRVKEGSSRYWLALLVMNTGNPVGAVQVESASGGWTDLARAAFNYWIAPSGAGQGPFTVRVSDTLGHQVTMGGVALEPGVVQDSGTWMYGAGSAPAPATAPRAAARSSAPAASPAPKARATATATAAGRRPGPAPATAVRQAAARVPGDPAAPASGSPAPTC